MAKQKTERPIVIGIDASRAFVENPAGPEYYSLNIIREMAKVDTVNRYVLYLRPGQKPNFRLPKNFTIRTIPFPFLWTQIGLAVETIFRPPAVIFVPAHTLAVLTRLLRPNLPQIVTIHGLEGKFLPQTGWFLTHIYRNWSITWAIRLAHHLICVSEDTKRDVLATYGAPASVVTTIHEGVDYDRFSQESVKDKRVVIKKIMSLRKKYKLAKTYIMFVGTIQPRKNLVRLIRAYARLRLQGMTSSDLVIAGKLGWNYEDMLKTPLKAGVEEHVRFIGRVSDRELPSLYKGALMAVFPAITEGFGLPVLEAQAASVPLVLAKAGALPEVSGGAAVFVNPLSVTSIFKGMERILKSRSLAQSLRRRGVLNAKKFTWTKAARSTVGLLVEKATR
jgi:glycosyltransferase involved in cell wall biosynthesis